MKKIISIITGLFFLLTSVSFSADELTIEKQLVGIIGAISGTVKAGTKELKVGDKVYLNQTVYAGADSGTQILLLDQTTFNPMLQPDWMKHKITILSDFSFIIIKGLIK